MNYSFFDFLILVGSLGLFLYGMKIMSEGLQKMAGDKMRSILTAMTKNRVMGVLTGLLITALIQSSSATTVMVVSFVNAGLLSLAQSISVIMGANIGTTVTAWIISLFGFKFSISVIAVPLIGLSIPFIFSKKSKRHAVGEFMVGFAFLFMGLDMLKDAVPDIKSNPDILAFLRDYTNMGMGSILLFLLIGTILTIVVQSSSATMAITLIMCSKGWISFEIAAAMVMGENIGTTITANLAALSANTSAKRAAFAHFLFNVFGVIWLLIFFYPFTSLIRHILDSLGSGSPDALMSQIIPQIDALPKDAQTLIYSSSEIIDPTLAAIQKSYLEGQTTVSYSLSLFHTVFNIINTFMMIWFVQTYVWAVSKVIHSKRTDEEFHLSFIHSGMLSTSEISLLQARKELIGFIKMTRKMFTITRSLIDEKPESESFARSFARVQKYEENSDRMEIEIAKFLSAIAQTEMSGSSQEKIHRKMTAATEIESMGDICFNIARTIRHRNEKKVNFSADLMVNINQMFDLCIEITDMLIELWDNEFEPAQVNFFQQKEEEINNFRNILRRKNTEDVNNKVYSYEEGTHYMDLILMCERYADYAVNVVEAMTATKSLKH